MINETIRNILNTMKAFLGKFLHPCAVSFLIFLDVHCLKLIKQVLLLTLIDRGIFSEECCFVEAIDVDGNEFVFCFLQPCTGIKSTKSLPVKSTAKIY